MTQSVTFHQIAPPSQWILVAIESTYAGQGRTYGRGDLFTEQGTLVGSYIQDGMVRQFDQAQAATCSLRRIELVDAELRAVSVAREIHEQVAQQPVDRGVGQRQR